MEKIILTTFTDPMMGLSYEQEPVYEKLAAHYGGQLEFRYVMAGLVRDVSDFMLPSELSLPAAEGIRQYNKRLAGIYKLPIRQCPNYLDTIMLLSEVLCLPSQHLI